MAESSPTGEKTLWEKEKLLVSSNFSFFHSVFKRPVLQTRKNQGLFGKGLKVICEDNIKIPPYPFTTIPSFKSLNPFLNKPTCLLYKSFENMLGKGQIAGNEQFLLFPKCFLPICRTPSQFYQI